VIVVNSDVLFLACVLCIAAIVMLGLAAVNIQYEHEQKNIVEAQHLACIRGCGSMKAILSEKMGCICVDQWKGIVRPD
jgi:hypothetical protein